MIDDKNIYPPYSRPEDKPLPKKKPSLKDMLVILNKLFKDNQSK